MKGHGMKKLVTALFAIAVVAVSSAVGGTEAYRASGSIAILEKCERVATDDCTAHRYGNQNFMAHSIVSINCPLETIEACLITHNRCDQLCDDAYPDRLTGEDADVNWDLWEACTEKCTYEWDICVAESDCNT